MLEVSSHDCPHFKRWNHPILQPALITMNLFGCAYITRFPSFYRCCVNLIESHDIDMWAIESPRFVWQGKVSKGSGEKKQSNRIELFVCYVLTNLVGEEILNYFKYETKFPIRGDNPIKNIMNPIASWSFPSCKSWKNRTITPMELINIAAMEEIHQWRLWSIKAQGVGKCSGIWNCLSLTCWSSNIARAVSSSLQKSLSRSATRNPLL